MAMVACGWRHTISVSYSGALYTYGWSKYGQLGHGDLEDHLVPHKLEALGNSVISQVGITWALKIRPDLKCIYMYIWIFFLMLAA